MSFVRRDLKQADLFITSRFHMLNIFATANNETESRPGFTIKKVLCRISGPQYCFSKHGREYFFSFLRNPYDLPGLDSSRGKFNAAKECATFASIFVRLSRKPRQSGLTTKPGHWLSWEGNTLFTNSEYRAKANLKGRYCIRINILKIVKLFLNIFLRIIMGIFVEVTSCKVI